MTTDLTTEILKQIRDGIKELREDFNQRLDQTNERLDQINSRLGRVEQGLNDLGKFMHQISPSTKPDTSASMLTMWSTWKRT